jgi:putative heme degradation protein
MQIALMFGQRKPGQVERADWRALASNLAETGRA